MRLRIENKLMELLVRLLVGRRRSVKFSVFDRVGKAFKIALCVAVLNGIYDIILLDAMRTGPTQVECQTNSKLLRSYYHYLQRDVEHVQSAVSKRKLMFVIRLVSRCPIHCTYQVNGVANHTG